MTRPSRTGSHQCDGLARPTLMIVSSATSVVPGGRECRELPQLLRREGNDLHVLTKQHHGVDRNGNRPGAKAQKTAEIHHNHDPAVRVANQSTNPAENVLALDRTEDLPAKKIADANRLREPHRGGFGQAHARRRRHASRRGALRMNQVRAAARKHDASRIRTGAERIIGRQTKGSPSLPNIRRDTCSSPRWP